MNAASRLARLEQLRKQVDALIEEERADIVAAPKADPVFMTIDAYCERRQVSRSTLHRWMRHGMPVSRRGQIVRIPVREADAWDEADAHGSSAERAAQRGGR